MSLYQSPPETAQLVSGVLRLIHADHYADESSPHWDADREYSAEQVALAARELVRAVDALPADQRPIEWDTDQPAAAPTAPADRAAVLREAADAIDTETRQAKADQVLEPDQYRPCRDASAQLRRMADEAKGSPS